MSQVTRDTTFKVKRSGDGDILRRPSAPFVSGVIQGNVIHFTLCNSIFRKKYIPMDLGAPLAFVEEAFEANFQ